MKEILKCINCNTYTIKKICPRCNSEAITPKPAKYSPEDKYGKWRRQYKNDMEN